VSTIIIFHGIGGNSEENWFPWIKETIEKKGHRVIIPDFPHADKPELHEWFAHMEKYQESIDDQTIFVGHSLGGIFALRLLEKQHTPIRATFLIASVTNETDGGEYAPLMTSFTVPDLHLETIKKNGGKFHVLHADNDPFIPLQNAEKLARTLGAAITIIPNGKHLNVSAGYTEFPILRDAILSAL